MASNHCARLFLAAGILIALMWWNLCQEYSTEKTKLLNFVITEQHDGGGRECSHLSGRIYWSPKKQQRECGAETHSSELAENPGLWRLMHWLDGMFGLIPCSRFPAALEDHEGFCGFSRLHWEQVSDQCTHCLLVMWQWEQLPASSWHLAMVPVPPLLWSPLPNVSLLRQTPSPSGGALVQVGTGGLAEKQLHKVQFVTHSSAIQTPISSWEPSWS